MNLAERYRSVTDRIERAAERAGRKAEDVLLIVVTKNHPASVVRQLYELGHRHFGENRDQEARPKAAELSESGCAEAIWHFVGQLQSNKVRTALEYASYIHSVDRPSLVAELEKQLEKRATKVSVFLELNLTDDPARGGVTPDALEPLVELVAASSRIQLLGVMAVAGLGVDPRIDFERTRVLSERVRQIVPSADKLSMGMSEDFELAIELGATHIRVGSAITGPRPIYA